MTHKVQGGEEEMVPLEDDLSSSTSVLTQDDSIQDEQFVGTQTWIQKIIYFPRTWKQLKLSEKIHNKIEKRLQAFFYELGLFVGHRPCLVIICSLIFILIATVGVSQMIIPADPEYAWSPFNSRARAQNAYVSENYGKFRIAQTIFQVDKAAKGNVLNKTLLLQAMEAHQRFTGMVDYDSEGNPFGYDSICFHPLPMLDCLTDSVLTFWDFDIEKLRQDPDILATINTQKTNILRTIDAPSLLGGIKYDENGQIVFAEAFYILYIIGDNPNKKLKTIQVEKNFIDVFEAHHFHDAYVTRFTRQAAHDEIDRAVFEDARLFVVSFFMMLFYVAFALGRFSLIHSKFLLGLAGIGVVILSIGCGFGIGGYLGSYWSPAAIAIPFLILGIGVDDMFIIVNGYHHADTQLSIPERLAKSLSATGASITITSLTDFVAFLVGSSTNLPALSSFCVFAAFSVLCDYLLQVTLFAALLVLNEKRSQSKRIDCVPCIKLSEPTCGTDPSDPEPAVTSVSNFFRKHYAPYLLSIPGRAIVIGLAVAVFILSLYGAANTGSHLSQFDIIPSDSYIFDYIQAELKYFSGEASGISLEIIFEDIDYANPRVQKKMLDLKDEILATKYVESVDSIWLEDFLNDNPQLANNPNNTDAFYPTLYPWLLSNGRSHFADIIFQYGAIKTSKFIGKHALLTTDFERADAITKLREVCDSYAPDVIAFPWNFRYLGWVPFLNLIPNNIKSFSLVILSIFVITFCFLGDLKMTLLVLLTVILVDIDLIGVMYFWDIGLNIISIVNLLLALGLAVDASAHIIHSILVAQKENPHKSNTEVVTDGLAYVGSSVFSGALTSFLGIVVLGFTNHPILLIFFKFFFSVFFLALFHGLCLIPVLLTITEPPASVSIPFWSSLKKKLMSHS